ncbi:hypothetical protein ABTM51_21230, partial [Acinetobacter baumannii]
ARRRYRTSFGRVRCVPHDRELEDVPRSGLGQCLCPLSQTRSRRIDLDRPSRVARSIRHSLAQSSGAQDQDQFGATDRLRL